MLIKSGSFVLIFLAFLGTNSCSMVGDVGNNQGELVDVRINHYRQTGIGEALHLVYLMQEGEGIGSENWSYLYEGIEGFDFELGYIYDLKARKVKVEDPPMDGSSIKYILVNVRSKKKVSEDETFEIKLKWGGSNFVTGSNNNFYLLDEYEIICSDLCEEFSQILQDRDEVRGTFVHGDSETLKLISIL
ncbi:DUF4377 domain-containing protein [Gramella jeungdoensis]|uniref:DUF4377 domain-containing protein n=1 Tax=Gramella jeungdoensis TaxID=708091 RepID=A0ABT0Z4V9_9FLAO|nr:DUF4377 domain-containing protein [Gramella jeungdoensis]MCM8570768.1 DUF4377 domain-containing protein [Gramella jeungdoensis]